MKDSNHSLELPEKKKYVIKNRFSSIQVTDGPQFSDCAQVYNLTKIVVRLSLQGDPVYYVCLFVYLDGELGQGLHLPTVLPVERAQRVARPSGCYSAYRLLNWTIHFC